MQTVADVPIAEVGTWDTMTGTYTFTEEDLRAAALAPEVDSAVKLPRIKLGHTDPRFAAVAQAAGVDGDPALGWVENLHVSDDGQVLLGDMRVPQWLADSMEWAYPSRSIEASYGVTTETGNSHEFIVTALALLGDKLPAVATLDDLQEVLSEAGPVQEVTARATVLASVPRRSHVMAGLDQDLVLRRFYEWVESGEADLPEGETAWDLWARSMRFDDAGKPYLKVQGDGTGNLYRVDFTISGSEVTFAGFTEVVEQDVPVAASTSRPPAPLAVWASREESRSTTPEQEDSPMTDQQRKALAQSLGLPEDADEAAINAKLEANDQEGDNPPAEQNPPPEAEPTAGDESGQQAPQPGEGAPAEPPEQVAASAGVVQVSAAQWQEAQDEIKRLRESDESRTEREHREHRDGLVAAAVREGRITPAERETWRDQLDKAPDATESLLASLAPGRTPVRERGALPQESSTSDEASHRAYMDQHFGGASASTRRHGGRVRRRQEA